MTSLDDLRRDIDSIDDQLLNLIDRRVEIGREIARAKGPNGGPFLRPGREAAILRRLSQQAQPPLGPSLIGRIWREILIANLAQQTAVTVAFSGGDGVRLLVRDHFGSSAQLNALDNMPAVIDAVASRRALLGVIALTDAKQPHQWWRDVLQTENPSAQPRVISRLPFFADGGAIEAVVIASFDSDSSGDDISFYVDCSGPEASWQIHETIGHPDDSSHCPPTGNQMIYLGTYPRPFND